MPRTLSGKKLEVPVKRILTGTPVEPAAAKGALANPESLTAFERLAGERSVRSADVTFSASARPAQLRRVQVERRAPWLAPATSGASSQSAGSG